MPAASKVRPKKWKHITVLFEDDRYAVISGEYDGDYCLGERWTGGADGIGYPSQGGNPLWHVVPEFLRLPVLHGLLDEAGRKRKLRKFAVGLAKEILEWQ
jgi:hypothetical protein